MTKGTTGLKLLCSVFELILKPIDHACGPDCLCWQQIEAEKIEIPLAEQRRCKVLPMRPPA